MSLFPLIDRPDDGVIAAAANLPLYRETDWNFQTNEPVWRGGNPVMVTGARAVLVWAWNALHTERFAHDVFSSDYGPDFSTLRGKPYTEEVRQAEAIRIIRESLLVNPYITDVTQVSAEFADSTLTLRFKLTTIYGEVSIDGCDITL